MSRCLHAKQSALTKMRDVCDAAELFTSPRRDTRTGVQVAVDAIHELKARQFALAQRDAEINKLRELIRELDDHEGAEGWSEGMRERIDAALRPVGDEP